MSNHKKNRHHEEEEHPHVHDESNWLVSYADMMTLLFGFFVLMYSMSRVDPNQFVVVSKDVAKFFGGRVRDDNGLKIATKMVKEDLMTYVTKLKDRGAVTKKDDKESSLAGNPKNAEGNEVGDVLKADEELEVREGVNSMILKFRGDILFKSASADLNPEFAEVLKGVSEKLKATGRVEEIRVEGHTDDDSIKSAIFPTNWELSAARASRVVRQFESDGLDPKQMIAQGFGASRPDVPNRDEEGKVLKVNQAKNRRVVVEVRFKPEKATAKALEGDFAKVTPPKKDPNVPAAGPSETAVAAAAEPPKPKTPEEIDAAIKEASEKLAAAQKELKEKEAADKKMKKLEEMQAKLDAINKKAEDVQSQLKDPTPSKGPAPASVQVIEVQKAPAPKAHRGTHKALPKTLPAK